MASYSIWQAIGTALQLAFRAEALARLREPGPPGKPGEKGDAGAPGRDGVHGQNAPSFSVRGTFNPEDAYRELDIVALNGGSFVALKDDPGPCPGPGWQLWAGQGKSGKPGDRGAKGDPGERGLDGAFITGGVLDAKTMKLAFTRSDGGTVTVDMLDLALALKDA